jgi:hypothetical protein
MFGFITFCDCKHAEQRLFSWWGLFLLALACASEFACRARWQQSRPKHLSCAESFWGGVLLGIMLAEEYVPPMFNSLKILWCHGVLVRKGTIYLL